VTGHRIAVLVPSRGRPENIDRLYNVIQETAADPDQVVLVVRVDHDDPDNYNYRRLESTLAGAAGIVFHYGDRTRLAASWNEMAGWAAKNQFTHLAFWGDDVVPETYGWDKLLVATLAEYGPGFAYGRDGVWDNARWDEHPDQLVLPTAALCDVGTFETLGWVSPERSDGTAVLKHLCIDMVWRDVGMAAGGLHYVPEVMLRHMHPIRGLAPYDQTYAEANEGAQASADHRAYPIWRQSDDFQRAVQRLGTYRAEVAALDKINHP
jgi:hypothetical protein